MTMTVGTTGAVTSALAKEVAGIYSRSWPLSVRHAASPAVVNALLSSRGWPFWREQIDLLGNGLDVVRRDGKAVAFSGWTSNRHEAELVWLFVAPDQVGRRFGATLHDSALGDMVRSGATRAHLWAVIGNEKAEAFYARRGWSATDQQKQVQTLAGTFPLRRWERALT